VLLVKHLLLLQHMLHTQIILDWEHYLLWLLLQGLLSFEDCVLLLLEYPEYLFLVYASFLAPSTALLLRLLFP
jgi:hypothetical protein